MKHGPVARGQATPPRPGHRVGGQTRVLRRPRAAHALEGRGGLDRPVAPERPEGAVRAAGLGGQGLRQVRHRGDCGEGRRPRPREGVDVRPQDQGPGRGGGEELGLRVGRHRAPEGDGRGGHGRRGRAGHGGLHRAVQHVQPLPDLEEQGREGGGPGEAQGGLPDRRHVPGSPIKIDTIRQKMSLIFFKLAYNIILTRIILNNPLSAAPLDTDLISS